MSRIFDPSLSWKDGDIPFSQGFDDIYFKADGLSETRVVFLEGNNLPQAWQNRKQFTIAETGFGTGLNFLATWKLFDETCTNGERLDFISVEQYPLHKDDLTRAVQRLIPEIGKERIERFLKIYPMRIPGFHRVWVTNRVTLTLIFDDALRTFKQLDCPIDAWFLDGFNPAKNDTMWHEDLYAEMARLSHSKTTLSSFTAVAKIRQDLDKAGFKIDRVKGYGYKKHRIIGKFQSDKQKQFGDIPEKISILGAGLAGAGIAYALKRRGIAIDVYDQAASLGEGASGNQLGLINPKIEAQDNPKNDVGLSAFSFAHHILNDLSNIDYNPSGALHLAFDEDKKQRLEKFHRNGSWLASHMRWVSKDENLCGVTTQYDGLYYSDAASVNTKKLVATLLNGASLHFEQSPEVVDILACGWGLYEKFPGFPLQPVRGQVTFIKAPHDLKCPIMFGSYIAPTPEGKWVIGATFDQNVTDKDVKTADDQRNLDALKSMIGIDAEPIESWSNFRTATRDRFPIVGKIGETYVSGALGSHGIQFGLLLGEIIACLITNAPLPIGRDALKKLLIDRFL